MTMATTSSSVRHSALRYAPVCVLLLAAIAVVLLMLAPIGWRAGWGQYRFSFLMPWAPISASPR